MQPAGFLPALIINSLPNLQVFKGVFKGVDNMKDLLHSKFSVAGVWAAGVQTCDSLPQRLGYETNIKHYRWWKLKQQTSTISNNSLGGKQLYLKIWFCLQLRPVQSINWRFDVFHTHGGHSCLPDTLEAEEKVYWWCVRNIALNRSTLKT